jgi:BolA family transcriptional regulator, general stress-responsive regulator
MMKVALGPIGEEILRKLSEALAPVAIEVIDESSQHAGHAGAHPSGESHFRVRIVAKAFAGETRIGRHRRVNQILASELKERVHALAVEAYAPGEPGASKPA